TCAVSAIVMSTALTKAGRDNRHDDNEASNQRGLDDKGCGRAHLPPKSPHALALLLLLVGGMDCCKNPTLMDRVGRCIDDAVERSCRGDLTGELAIDLARRSLWESAFG